jgi:NAD(P)-dependent dehydrogenase (short-subunit alcohol dehydrogenase family)
MQHPLSGKTIIITGGAGGLGRELITQLLALKANVAALDLDVSSLPEHENLLKVALDITQTAKLAQAVQQTLQLFGQIDCVIHNAGITHMSRFEDTSDALFDTIMQVNFTASVALTRLCQPHLIEQQGQIVAVSSVAGFAPLYGRSAYAASKHAMEGFFRSLRSELADDKVSVLIVAPSFIRSRPELNAQVNNGISSPGANKKSTGGETLSPEYAAHKIIHAMSKRQPQLLLGRVSVIAWWLSTLFPKLYQRVMVKGAKKEFVGE